MYKRQRVRHLGWRGPILLLEGVFEPRDLELCSRLGLWHAVHCDEQIDMLAAHKTQVPHRVFLKMNSGMNRLGFTPERYRAHFRILCDALAQWMAGVISPQGMPSWNEFSAGVRSALDHVRHHHAGQNVLLVSSGGPISTAVGEVLGTAPEVTIALNMRIRNSAVTEFSISPKRLMLQTFNTLPHLNELEHAQWVTHA
mgnify:CR=1 FL=1